jgi:hypothetical protein
VVLGSWEHLVNGKQVQESPDVFRVLNMPHDALTLFDCSPENFPWRQPIASEIQNRRAQMSNQLIFDLLLSSAGIQQPETLFPPVDEAELDRLLVAISESEFDDLKKNSLLYWLLKWHNDGREDIFQAEKSIPPQFVILADVYWLLDTGHDLNVRGVC